jgi:hypothetical protein
MTIDSQERPPPPPSAPDDFDDAMRLRWQAWKDRGRVDAARARRQAGTTLAVCGVVGLTAFLWSALLAR